MRVVAHLAFGAEGAEAQLVRALAEGALAAVERQFGRDGHDFAVAIQPSPERVEIAVRFDTSLPERRVSARMPLASVLLDVPFDAVDMDWENN